MGGMRVDRSEFFKKFRMTEQVFSRCNYDWKELEDIYENYINLKSQLDAYAIQLVDEIKEFQQVHSVKFRTKDPEHLIEKIIRKNIKNPDFHPRPDNYCGMINDLIGIRILHLFKEDWESIHHIIMERWELKERVVANIRQGDSRNLIDNYSKNDCDIKVHPSGYRSVHYLIRLLLDDLDLFAEIQVRTIFEEAWSEIDHAIRYPYYMDNNIFSDYLEIINRLAGSADEMGSFIRRLRVELNEIDSNHRQEIEAKNLIIGDLKQNIESLEIDLRKKEELEEKLEQLNRNISTNTKQSLTLKSDASIGFNRTGE